MTSSLLATTVALTAGLQIFALGEHVRKRRERHPRSRRAAFTRKDALWVNTYFSTAGLKTPTP